jgi:ABC-type amino acid transport substrate-binding protein
VQYDFKSLVSGLKRGDFDFAMNGLELTPDRLKAIRFSRPCYVDRLGLVVRRSADRVVVLADGEIIEDGSPSVVLDHPQTRRAQRFLSRVMT